MTRKLLVTGGAGFIGCNFVRYWRSAQPEDRIVVLDALTYAGRRDNLAGLENAEFHFIEGNICDTDLVASLLLSHDIDTVVNFAAESHVDRSISGPDAFIETNVIGTHSLLKAARQVWLAGSGREHRFHHVSTDEVYGSLDGGEAAFTEAHRYQPNSPYSASKAASDHLVRAYHHTYGLQVSTSNCSNNYGPYHYPEKLIPLAVTQLLRGGTVPVYGDGKNVRDWLFVEDHARGIEAVLERGAVGEIYNIGGNTELTNIELLGHLCEVLDECFAREPSLVERFPEAPASRGGKSVDQLEFVSDRPGHDRRYAIDTAKIAGELGFLPQTDFRTGIARTVRWYLDNAPWWAGRLPAQARR